MFYNKLFSFFFFYMISLSINQFTPFKNSLYSSCLVALNNFFLSFWSFNFNPSFSSGQARRALTSLCCCVWKKNFFFQVFCLIFFSRDYLFVPFSIVLASLNSSPQLDVFFLPDIGRRGDLRVEELRDDVVEQTVASI